jgi:hypothetical protein
MTAKNPFVPAAVEKAVDCRTALVLSPLITGIPFNVALPYVIPLESDPTGLNTRPVGSLLVTRFKDIPVTLIFAVKAESIQVVILGAMGERVEFVVRKSVDDGKIVVLNVSVPTFEMLHRFILRAPVIDVALVTVSAPRVAVPVTPALFVTVRELRVVVAPKEALAVTVRELRVVVPVALIAPETVTFPPADGLRTILLLAVIWTLLPELIAIEPS